MRQILQTAVAAALLSTLLGIALAQSSSVSGALSVANLNVAPEPILPGQNVTIYFQLYNSYTSSLSNVNLWLQ
ncbi:MAG: hypothetical protein KGH50_02620, partial [Candidatus Micrarchaeota archaeon]|nr:hypothetical protein [Candidatus Micrarchaeota archaeon]